MKLLVLGGGGREHALVWALRNSAKVTEVVCAPGNAGIAKLARCVPVDLSDVEAVRACALAERPHLVVVGPEIPLAAGVVDVLSAEGLRTFGPTQAAARLESSKGFAKDFMRRWGIPTAKYRTCSSIAEVQRALGGFPEHVVLKADGLAAGKGVVLCDSHEDALRAAEGMFDATLLGVRADQVVLEEKLHGPEISFFSFCDGTRARTLGFAQDHKRAGEGDTGQNTGGMGAYSTEDLVSAGSAEWLHREVAQRVVDGMRSEGTPFRGMLFTGLMLTEEGPRVLEFNTRFGDPETEALLLRLDCDLFEILAATADGHLEDVPIQLKPGAAASVIVASAGYPGPYVSGKVIHGLEHAATGVEVFHAGTKIDADHQIVTAGGRVLAVSAVGPTLQDALADIYRVIAELSFEGMQFRRDIGWRALGKS